MEEPIGRGDAVEVVVGVDNVAAFVRVVLADGEGDEVVADAEDRVTRQPAGDVVTEGDVGVAAVAGGV